MNKIVFLSILSICLACSSNADKRPLRTNTVLGCRGNYDCEPSLRCIGTREELLAGMGLCSDIHHPRSGIKNY